jgi:DNA repair protein RecN (Recombination protein N)
MLVRLSIHNLAIIDRLCLDLRAGFTAITGETGAGKSIIIGALNLALGERASSEDIRSGMDEAVIEALFDVSRLPRVRRLLAEQGLADAPGDDGADLVVRREISRQGRGRCLVNGRLATVGQLREIGDQLVDLHGQHQHQSLLRMELHREILDNFGDARVRPARDAWRADFDEYRRVLERLRALNRDEREVERLKGLLEFQLREIREAQLEDREDERLEEERGRLRHVDALMRNTAQANDMLYEGEQSGASAVDLLIQCEKLLEQSAELDPSLSERFAQIAELRAQVEDLAAGLRSYADSLDADPARLAEVEDRLHLIRRLKKKYGASVADILAEADKYEKELHGLTHGAEERAALEAERARLEKSLATKADALTEARREAGRRFAKGLRAHLAELEMPGVEFEVQIARESADERRPAEGEETDAPERGAAASGGLAIAFPDGSRQRIFPWGADIVEFLISPNRGEGLKPLRRIASGGELSRVMLALKALMGDQEQIPTLIFDEIDTGISGRAGSRVGDKMAGLGKKFQVVCITHLAQIAARAGRHLAVRKETAGKRVITRVEELDRRPARLGEIARLLGGEPDSEIARQHADELLAQSAG